MLNHVGAKKNGVKTWVAQKYSPTHSKIKFWRKHLWVKRSCWGGVELKFVAKTCTCKKKKFLQVFPIPIKKCLSWFMFLYA